MISKELLSEVLHGGRIIIKYLENMENCLEYISYCSINEMNGTKYNENLPDNYYVVKADRWQEINIYELAHKCKEWAFNKGGIDITSGKRLGLDGWECLVFIGVIPCDCYEAETEPEAIFKACEWILENR